MRWNIRRSRLIFGLLPIVALIFYMLTANGGVFANQSYFAVDAYKSISDTREKPKDGTTPGDYDARINFAIAAGIIEDNAATPFYSSTTTGKIVANIMNYTQEVENFKAVKNGDVFAESISLSTFASVAEQKYFDGGNILYRKAKTSGKKVVSWPETITNLSKETFSAKYGVIPRGISKYSVTVESFKSGSMVSNDNGTYTFTMELDAEKAQFFAKREMMTFANVTTEPEFYTCNLTYVIDSDWKILSVKTEDYYKIDMMGGIKCRSTLNETFSYEGDMPERAKIFIDYDNVGGEEGEIPIEKSAADYLQEAFGDYLTGGKSINLDAGIKLLGNDINLKASIDINNSSYSVKLGDIFVAYQNENIYINNQNFKGKILKADLNKLTKQLNLDLGDITGIFNDPNLLEKLFENTVIQETATHVIIPMKFTLVGIDFDVKLNLLKNANGKVSADTITGAVDLSKLTGYENMVLNADIKLSDVSLSKVTDSEYINFDKLINSLLNTVNAKTYDLGLSANIKNNNTSQDVSALIKLVRGADSITAGGTLSAFNTSADFNYNSGEIFAKLGNIKLKLQTDKINKITEALAIFGVNTNVDAGAIIKDLIPAILPSEISIKTILDIIYSVNYDGNTIELFTLPAIGGKVTVKLTHNDTQLTGLDISGLNILNNQINAKVELKSISDKTDPVTVTTPQEYIDVNELLKFAPAIKELMSAKSFEINISNGSLNTPVISGEYSGTVTLVNSSPLSLQADLTFRTHKILLTLKDNQLYLKINDINLKLKLSDIDSLTQILAKYLPQTDVSAITAITKTTLSAANLTKNSLGNLDINSILSMIDRLGMNDDGTIGLSLHFGELSISLGLGLTEDNKLKLNITNLNYGNALTDVTLYSTLNSYNDELPISIGDKESYVDIIDLATFIDPIANTVNQKFINISFGGSVVAADKTTEISGELKVIPTKQLANIYALINLSDTSGANHKIELYLIDGRVYTVNEETGEQTVSGDIHAYINYNEFKVTISYQNALRVIGAFKDILNLKIPMLDTLLEGIYTTKDASVFETLNIAGLNELRDTINGLFANSNNAGGSINEIIGGLLGNINDSAETIDKILSGLKIGYVDSSLIIQIDNGIFDSANGRQFADISLSHNGELLSGLNIANLHVNGNTVNFGATLSCDEFEPITAPEGYRDFNSIDDLLASVITTASMREFEITGTLTLDLPIVPDAKVPLNVKVKILPDGSTAAAIKLQVPYYLLALTKTDSYIYYANNRLYFIVDVYKTSWGKDKYDKTEIKSCSVDEFLSSPIDYLFYLVRMSDLIAKPIKDAINKPSSGDGGGALDLNQILKDYSFDGTSYKLKIGLGALTGNKNLNDADIGITTSHDYITSLRFNVGFVDAIGINLGNGANLVNIKYEDGIPVGANPVSNTSFGQKHSGDKQLTIDNLADDLNLIFPEYAPTSYLNNSQKALSRAMISATAAENFDAIKSISTVKAELSYLY